MNGIKSLPVSSKVISVLKLKLLIASIIVILGLVLVTAYREQQNRRLAQAHVVGDEQSHKVVVYLHGMDLPSPSTQEIANRTKLDAIGKALSIKILLPRASEPCPQDHRQICWRQKTDKDVTTSLAGVLASLKLDTTDQITGFIGFSNGGYLVNKWIQHCLLEKTQWVMSIGSAGSWGDDDKSLSSCSPITLIIGRNDRYHYKHALAFYDHLRFLHANATLVVFDGGHELPERALQDEISRF